MSDEMNPKSTRRTFLKGALVSGGAFLAQSCAGPTTDGKLAVEVKPDAPSASLKDAGALQPSGFDFSTGSPALGGVRVRSACQFCNANCGLDVRVNRGRVVQIAPIDGDAVQAGQICVKAEMMGQIAHSGHRLRRPLLRVAGAKGDQEGSKFKEVSWDEALEVVARRFLKLRDAGQAHTIANRTSGRMLRGAGSIIARFFDLLGSPNATDVGPVCNDAGGNALSWTFGLGNFTNGYGVDPITGSEDLGSSDFVFMLGTNQAETHPVTFAHLLRHRPEGGQIVVVDPRKTPTGVVADRWIAPKPHTDMALVLAMLHTIVTEELYDRKFVAEWVLGFDALAAHLKEKRYTAEWAAKVCDLEPGQIRELARGFAGARRASIFCNAGISHQLGAFDTYRALAFLSAITGNIGKPGGGCNFMHNTWPGGLSLTPFDGKFPEKSQPSLPVGPDTFAQAILEQKPYALKAIVTQGNPLLASANSNRVRAAFEKLDFYVYTGLFMEESAYYADVILPVAAGLEFEGVYMRRDDRGIRWQDAALPRLGESKTDTEIWVELAAAMGRLDKRNGAAYWMSAIRAEWSDYKVLWDTFAENTPGVGGMTRERMRQRDEPLRWPCPDVSHPGTSTLYLDDPAWYSAAEVLGGKRGARFLTPSGKVEIYTKEMDKKLQVSGHAALPTFYTHPEVTGQHPSVRYTKKWVRNPVNPHALTPKVELGVTSQSGVHGKYPLMGMIGRSSVAHFAGVTHWTATGKQIDGIRYIQIHPNTARAAKIKDGQEVIVESPRGRIKGTAAVWKEIRPDTIFVPNGFGPSQVVGPETSAPRYKSAANALVDDRYFDALSGQQAYKCFACRVRPA